MKSSALKSSCMFDTQSKNRNETATKIKIQNKTKKASGTNEVKEKKKIQPGSVLEVPAFVSSSPHIVACRLKKVNIVTIVTIVTFVTFVTFATFATFATFVTFVHFCHFCHFCHFFSKCECVKETPVSVV